MRHDRGHVAIRLEAGQHVLDEHQVSFFAGLGAPFAKARGELHAGAAVVLRERRIGKDAVKLADLPVLQNLWVLQRVRVFDREARDVVEDHVHDADRPDRAVGILAVEGKIVRVLTLFLNILMALDQEAARADGRVVNFVARLRLHDLHQQADDFAGRVELAAFLARAVGEILDQVFVGSTEQVGELEVVVHQTELGLIEVVEQVLPLLVGNLWSSP